MSTEKAGGVTLEGSPLTLVGPVIEVGDRAPDFKVLANDMSEVSLGTDSAKVRVILSVPSLDTPVCDEETRRFNEKAARFPDNVVVYAISCDLPFAQGRWCAAAKVANLRTLSDHRDVNFGEAFGTHVKELRLLSRAVFLVDRNDIVRYVEYVPEIGEHPDYEAVLQCVKSIST